MDSKATLEKLVKVTAAALSGDEKSISTLRLVGESLLIVGGIESMREPQGQLHDYAVDKYRMGSRGSAIGSFWEHLPQWANL